MAGNHGQVTDLRPFDTPEAAIERLREIYRQSLGRIRDRWQAFGDGDRTSTFVPACYPYIGIEVEAGDVRRDLSLAYGQLSEPGTYGTTIADPDMLISYFTEQLTLLGETYGKPFWVGISDRPIPLPFAIEQASVDISADDVQDIQRIFPMPDLSVINDAISNGQQMPDPSGPKPLSLFSAERTDYSMVRLRHYTGTDPAHFQRYLLFTNYQRYVDEFVEYGHAQIASGGGNYQHMIEPGNVVHSADGAPELPEGTKPAHLPQMPAYHLVGPDRSGITLVNIGVGPSNAKTITDHLAVLRPHCWIIVGHCGGLRRTQRLGDYVLANAYVRDDHVLDDDLPTWVPVPTLAEVQLALTAAVTDITGASGAELKSRVRTGTVYTTDDRNWELRRNVLAGRFN